MLSASLRQGTADGLGIEAVLSRPHPDRRHVPATRSVTCPGLFGSPGGSLLLFPDMRAASSIWVDHQSWSQNSFILSRPE